jgi:hypothetical protein
MKSPVRIFGGRGSRRGQARDRSIDAQEASSGPYHLGGGTAQDLEAPPQKRLATSIEVASNLLNIGRASVVAVLDTQDVAGAIDRLEKAHGLRVVK